MAVLWPYMAAIYDNIIHGHNISRILCEFTRVPQEGAGAGVGVGMLRGERTPLFKDQKVSKCPSFKNQTLKLQMLKILGTHTVEIFKFLDL